MIDDVGCHGDNKPRINLNRKEINWPENIQDLKFETILLDSLRADLEKTRLDYEEARRLLDLDIEIYGPEGILTSEEEYGFRDGPNYTLDIEITPKEINWYVEFMLRNAFSYPHQPCFSEQVLADTVTKSKQTFDDARKRYEQARDNYNKALLLYHGFKPEQFTTNLTGDLTECSKFIKATITISMEPKRFLVNPQKQDGIMSILSTLGITEEEQLHGLYGKLLLQGILPVEAIEYFIAIARDRLTYKGDLPFRWPRGISARYTQDRIQPDDEV